MKISEKEKSKKKKKTKEKEKACSYVNNASSSFLKTHASVTIASLYRAPLTNIIAKTVMKHICKENIRKASSTAHACTLFLHHAWR